MANRLFTQFRYSLEKKIVDIYAKATIGAVGAPTIVPARSKGVASIARTGVGAYTITLQDAYADLLLLSNHLELAAGSPLGLFMKVVAYNSTSTKTYQVQFLDAAGVAVEVASGSVLKLKFELKDSSV